MKTTKLMIMGGALLMMISCDNNERDNERSEAKDSLEDFVDSVEKVADDRADHNWNELDRRYNSLEQRAEAAYVNADDKDREDLLKVERRYEEAKVEGKKKEVEMNQTAEMHIKRVEDWKQNSATTTTANRNAANNNTNNRDNMDNTVKESVDWLEDNFEKLGSDMRTRYESIRADVRTDDRG